MTNLVLSVEDTEIELVDKYMQLRHEIRISRDNLTCELNRRIALERYSRRPEKKSLRPMYPTCAPNSDLNNNNRDKSEIRAV